MANDTMDELTKRAKQLVERLNQISLEKDVEKQTAMAAELQRDALAFEELGNRYVQGEQKRLGRGYVQVVLTPDQQKRIFAKTGVQMDLLVIEDQVGAVNQTMPLNPPTLIEKLALDEAERRRQAGIAETQIRGEIERVFADLERQQNSDINAQLERMKDDPNFLGGALKKK